MRKHGIILSVYSIIAALYIALSLILTTDRNTVFWIGFAMVLFAVGLTAVITVVTNRKRSSAFPLEISMVAFSAIYVAVVVAINILFGFIFNTAVNIFISIHLICMALYAIITVLMFATKNNDTTDNKTDSNKINVIDFSAMNKADIENWAATNKVTVKFSEDYSDTVASGSVISQNKKANETVKEGATIKVVISKGQKPSIEYQNALKQAETYSEMMHMSKKAIFDQLTSEYGGQFEDDAAQYAIDNLDADYKKNALESAKTYQSMMSMSKSAIYDQLVSEYGGQFTAEEAQYAIDHLDD